MHSTPWQKRYADKVMTARDALKAVKRGHTVFVGSGASGPQVLVEEMAKWAVDQIDALVENDAPLPEFRYPEPDEVAMKIGENVASLIEDGSTLQLGIGAVPASVLCCLKDKKDLGIHTEMLTDAILDLIEAGVVTNARKTLHRGKAVISFCVGTKRLYDFVDRNPFFEFHPSDYVNDPFVISQISGKRKQGEIVERKESR